MVTTVDRAFTRRQRKSPSIFHWWQDGANWAPIAELGFRFDDFRAQQPTESRKRARPGVGYIQTRIPLSGSEMETFLGRIISASAAIPRGAAPIQPRGGAHIDALVGQCENWIAKFGSVQ